MADFWTTISTLQKRKGVLDLEAARFGYRVPADTAMEIEDIEKVLKHHSVVLLVNLEKRLNVLLNQATTFGTSVPPHILTEIDTVRAQIATYKNDADTNVGFHFELTPGVDVEEQQVYRNVPPPTAQSPRAAKSRVGAMFTTFVDGSPYTGTCIAEQHGKLTIEWQYRDVTFTVTRNSDLFALVR